MGPKFEYGKEGHCDACWEWCEQDKNTGLCPTCWRHWRWSANREQGVETPVEPSK